MEKVKVIQDRPKTARIRQKSYAGMRRRELEFDVVGNVAYELELTMSLGSIHPLFHVSMLMKCVGDPSLVVSIKNVGVSDFLSYEEVPIEILDRQVRRLRTKDVSLVKVLLRNHKVEEATWEAKEDIKAKYPFLFHVADEEA
ncbi:uncharacterized protein LOC124888850 [Capsicum annuum]|uniref:uncharacterized protein LOC124888850 n=1 Tax=Capsicum annuum TaxID=4072 RepID=UPI001FB0A97F|nr:uncharacterized protein LOC124888850 [Capsicum annuum]